MVGYLRGSNGLFVSKRNGIRAILILTIISLALLQTKQSEPELLQQILDSGQLNVGFRLGPLVYYERDDIAGGLDYYMLQAFADSLGLELNLSIVDEIPSMLAQVQSGAIDIAAANLTVTQKRSEEVTFSQPYLNVSAILIQHSSRPAMESLDEILGASLVAIQGSSHSELLRSLQTQYPELSWTEEADTIMFQLMERVQDQTLDYALVDSSVFELERPYFPRVEKAMELDDPSPVAFALQKSSDSSLADSLNSFLSEYRSSGNFDSLVTEIFSNNENFNVASSLVLKERIQSRLPEYEALLRSVGEQFDIDWVMLAAVAYQESHWDASARSYTGVRGLMMLTLPTASQYGVTNRLDAEQSLIAGTKYLINLKSRLPERIGEPDRTQMALAAYNMGMGHLEDARILTQRAGKSPDYWDQVREQLPLLQQAVHYKTVAYGYARGLEADAYVENIFHFYNILDSYAWQKELEEMEMGHEEEWRIEDSRPAFQSILGNPLSPM